LVGLSFTLLVACGGQEPKVETAQTTKTANTVTAAISTLPTGTDPMQNGTSTSNISTPLLASLALLYPNGKMPENMAAEAAKQLAQSSRAFKNTGRDADLRVPSSFNTTGGQQPQSMRSGDGLYTPIYRYINSDLYGAYFFSTYAIQRSTAQLVDPNFLPEGPLFEVAEAYSAGLSPVYRFRNRVNNTVLETIDLAERLNLLSNPELANLYDYESIAWYARSQWYSGWVPLYRFHNTVNDSYLFTADQTEKSVISSSYSQVFTYEGIAYFVKALSPSTPATYVSIFPKVATQNVKTDFVVEGTNVPLDAQLSFPSLTCETPTNRTSTGFGQKCTMNGGTEVLGMVMAGSGTKLLGYRQIELIPATVEPIYTGNLPDTGVTSEQCYGAGSNVLISCTSAAAIALNSKQDGMVGRDVTAPAAADGKLGFSYSDVPNATGGVYDKTECVKDNITGLTWEGKTTNDLRSIHYAYTNYDSTTKAQKWNFGNPSNPSQTEIESTRNSVGYKNYVNSIALCGFTNWRLPTAAEYDGLISIATRASYLDEFWFPNSPPSFTEQWTSTDNTNPFDSFAMSRAWKVLGDARIQTDYRDFPSGIRLVRDSRPDEINRYSYINNGTEVVDSKTKLIWKRCAEGRAWSGSSCAGAPLSYAHEQALIHADTQTGWRLPNRKELVSIIDFSSSAASANNEIFQSDRDTPYWSSSPHNYSSDYIWIVDLNAQNLAVGSDYRIYFYTRNFRLVRNAP
jgi:Protein of unknown function (DUF1566)/Repeat of unknown function (DUF5648)